MILVIFGLFNVITAPFVEAILSGLKTNDVRKKHSRMYEANYVEKKLKALVQRIYHLSRPKISCRTTENNRNSLLLDGVAEDIDTVVLSEAAFHRAMRDPIVNNLFDDLDVDKFNRAGLFDMFDVDCNGLISMSELIEMIMKLRGKSQKSDIIASYMALRSMRQHLEEFHMLLLGNQKRIMIDQRLALNGR